MVEIKYVVIFWVIFFVFLIVEAIYTDVKCSKYDDLLKMECQYFCESKGFEYYEIGRNSECELTDCNCIEKICDDVGTIEGMTFREGCTYEYHYYNLDG